MDADSNDGINLSIEGDLRFGRKGRKWIVRSWPDFIDGLEMVAEIRAEPARNSGSEISRVGDTGFATSQEGLKMG
jgi:hypothetical protein